VRVETPIAVMSSQDAERCADHAVAIECSGDVPVGVGERHQKIGSDETAGRDSPNSLGDAHEFFHLVQVVEQANLGRHGRTDATHGGSRLVTCVS